jgi:putative copper resistance protein D
VSPADVLLIAVRAIHFGATMVLFGEMVFAAFIAVPKADAASLPAGRASGSSDARFLRVAVAAWACMLVSGACWFAFVSMQMSERPLAALDRATIAAVLGSTVFGRDWSIRVVLALALAAMWPILFAKEAPRRRRAQLACLIVSGALLASLAWAGHANAQVGRNGVIHHVSDSVHLLAAGAWLGGLAPLASLLWKLQVESRDVALADWARGVTRFGDGAALSVGALVMTGLVNAYYLLPEPKALLETTYGKLLLFKIFVFLIMLGIAAENRRRLTPALNASGGCQSINIAAVRVLRRNVLLEQALGALVILLVAALGVSPPTMKM